MDTTAPHDDDRWTEVLAGRMAPDDAHTRRAARARQVLAAQLHADIDAAPDEAAAARWLRALEVRAATLRVGEGSTHPVFTASAPAPRPPRLREWTLSLSAAWQALGSPRWAGAMAVVFGLGVAVVWTWPQLQDEDLTGKTVAPAPAPAPTPGSALMAPSADPLEDALALREALRALGVQSMVVELGEATRVDATVAPAAQAAVAQLMQDKGVAWVAGPNLSVQFQARR